MYDYREAGCAARRHVCYTVKDDLCGIYLKNMTYTPYFFRRNRDLGTISVYGGYRDVRCLPPPICIYMVSIYIVSAN